MPATADPGLVIRACGALALMSARYWPTVAPRAGRQLRRWHTLAQAIPDPALRALALDKLANERFNAQTAPTFATLVPAALRPLAVEAIVAVQVIYDYLDGLTEQTARDSLSDGHASHRALADAVSPTCSQARTYAAHDDGGYLEQLVAAARDALAQLPACGAVAASARAAAERCGQAQVRAHAVPTLGTAPLEAWAHEHAETEGESWRELIASSASAVISIHALIAAAGEAQTTPEDARRIERFHRATCALATILDGLADRACDQRSRDHFGYLHYFPDGDQLAGELLELARRALREARDIRHGGHHLMTLAGVVAYYTSALEAGESTARSTVRPLQKELQPLILPTLTFMRTWRHAKRLRRRHGPQRDAANRSGPRSEDLAA